LAVPGFVPAYREWSEGEAVIGADGRKWQILLKKGLV
jgi:hypothetical protein